jgi:hypothetical protein
MPQKLKEVYDNWGYRMIRDPKHPDANINGYIRRSRLVMEKKLGRRLSPTELVWHVDGDKKNDQEGNLSLAAPRLLSELVCPVCHEPFQPSNARIRHCSVKCGAVSIHRCDHPTKEKLQWLVWERPTSQLKDEFGVSDVAISKWCRRLGVNKPPRGYWAKVHAGVIGHKNKYPQPKE